ncbi:MAG TPA: tetratricopeptide repeat protein, partial [Nitrospirota bacterium]
MAIDKNAVAREAQKFAAKGQFDKAIAEWKKLVRESPKDANIFNTIGDLCLKKNSKTEAVDAYKRAADILAEDGFASKAIALYKKVLNIDPAKVEAHLALGGMNAEKGLIGNALESYKIVADHYKKNKQMDKALGIYQKMADLNPSNVAFRMKLADMYAKEDMKQEAAKAYLAAADAHVSKNEFKDARQLFEKALSLDPGNKEVYHKAGIVYLKEGKFAEACKALKPAFDNDPANRELADAYLDALNKAGKGHEAEQLIRKILSEDSSRTDLQEKLLSVYLENRDFEKALEASARLADASVEKGDPDGAVDILKKFIAASPHFSPGRWKLGELYVTLDRGQDAAHVFLQAAEVLVDEGDREGARAALTRALEIIPDMAEAKELLDRLASAAGPPPEPEAVVQEPEPVMEQEPAASAPTFEAFEPEQFRPEQPAARETPPAPPAEAFVEEEDPAVAEAFTEADVLIKYGLTSKAAEQLEALTAAFPENPRLRIKLRDLYIEQGNIDKAVSHALSAADLYAKRGAHEDAEAVLDAARKLAPSGTGKKSPEATPEKPPSPAAAVAPKTPAVIAEAADTFGEEPPVYETPPFSDNDDIVLEGFDSGVPPLDDSASAEPLPAPEMPAPEEERTHAPQASAAPGSSAETGSDINEIWAEAEFYFQQGLFDEAKRHYAKIIELTPGDKRAINRL